MQSPVILNWVVAEGTDKGAGEQGCFVVRIQAWDKHLMNAKTQRAALWLFFSFSAAYFAVTIRHLHANDALQEAACDGNLPQAQEALHRGADIDVRDTEDCTPLMYAAERGNVGIAQFLLAHGASINATNGYHLTVLSVAAENGSEDVAALLLKSGADLSDENVRQAIDFAYSYPHIAAMLKEAQAQRRRQTKRA